eukprot:CAMPEP_0117441510 /NCGR_PEP_ID=MMETSP0759-20121206/3672_1 /TAXON_ID=63605 /ORGANISM="Percolomonas cosmopolitus, Strain WS" /LENGTH=405 /DNA_ID=CAMNT_0005233367 /DNA_START=95 /DNA_END=1313 /DNA_ORIENTATION=-
MVPSFSTQKQIKYDLDLINEETEKGMQKEFSPAFEKEISQLSAGEIYEQILPMLNEQNFNKVYYWLRHWYNPKREFNTIEDAMVLTTFGMALNIFGFGEEAKKVLKKSVYLYQQIYEENGGDDSKEMKEIFNALPDGERGARSMEFYAYGTLGQLYFSSKEYDSAIVYLRSACDLNNTEEQIMSMLAIAYSNTNQAPRAAKVFDDLLEQNPEDDALISRVGSFYQTSLKDNAKAEEFYKKAISINSNNAHNRYVYGIFLINAKNDVEACAKELKESINANARFWPAHTALGEIQYNKGNYTDAVQLLQNAIQNDRNVEGKHFIMAARSFMNLGDNKRAEEIFGEYIKNAKGSQYADPNVFFEYADLLKQMDRARSAAQVYKAILSFVELPQDVKEKAEKLLKGVE